MSIKVFLISVTPRITAMFEDNINVLVNSNFYFFVYFFLLKTSSINAWKQFLSSGYSCIKLGLHIFIYNDLIQLLFNMNHETYLKQMTEKKQI